MKTSLARCFLDYPAFSATQTETETLSSVSMAGCGHSKIARIAHVVFVFVLYVAVLPSLQFLTVTKTAASRKL